MDGISDAMIAAPNSTAARYERVLLPHENPMTLGGTNAYIVAARGASSVIVIDPGSADLTPLRNAIGRRRVALILLTHHHQDHSLGAAALRKLSGAPIRAWRNELCAGGDRLSDGEDIGAAGVVLRVLHTPGHTSDSVCFSVPGGGADGWVFTGDTLLGHGTTIIEHPDGRLGDYLVSLDRLEELGEGRVLPGHGPERRRIAETVVEYRARRLGRLAELQRRIDDDPRPSTVSELTTAIYPGKTHPRLRRAAERTVLAQLRYLADPRGDETLREE